MGGEAAAAGGGGRVKRVVEDIAELPDSNDDVRGSIFIHSSRSITFKSFRIGRRKIS